MKPIYLDHNSTTPIDPEVVGEMSNVFNMQLANPSSQHHPGQYARKILEQLKTEIVRNLGGKTGHVDSDRLIVTSGGTESNNLALIGIANAQKRLRQASRVVISSIEHPSLIAAADFLAEQGFDVVRVPCSESGLIDMESFEQSVTAQTCVASLMIANHETGVIQPVRQAARICRKKNVPIHSDASQGIGKIPVDFSDLDLDAMTISPHKFHGPRGIGGLLIRHDLELDPLLYGGAQQLATRPGTESIALVAGFAKAIQKCNGCLARMPDVQKWRDHMERDLLAKYPETRINGREAERLPNTSNLAFADIDRQALLIAADLAGICFSTGSACASGSSEPSPVLSAMQLSKEIVDGSIRVSLGVENDSAEVARATSEISAIVGRLTSETGC